VFLFNSRHPAEELRYLSKSFLTGDIRGFRVQLVGLFKFPENCLLKVGNGIGGPAKIGKFICGMLGFIAGSRFKNVCCLAQPMLPCRIGIIYIPGTCI
jgi:hypothetical protein